MGRWAALISPYELKQPVYLTYMKKGSFKICNPSLSSNDSSLFQFYCEIYKNLKPFLSTQHFSPGNTCLSLISISVACLLKDKLAVSDKLSHNSCFRVRITKLKQSVIFISGPGREKLFPFWNLQWKVGGQAEFCFSDVFLQWSHKL